MLYVERVTFTTYIYSSSSIFYIQYILYTYDEIREVLADIRMQSLRICQTLRICRAFNAETSQSLTVSSSQNLLQE